MGRNTILTMNQSEYQTDDRLFCENCQKLVDCNYDWEDYSNYCAICGHCLGQEEELSLYEDTDSLFERLDEMDAIDLSDGELDMLGRSRDE